MRHAKMLRILLYVAALVALFGGSIVYGGNAIGAWDPLPPAPTPPHAVTVEREKPAKAGKQKKQAREIVDRLTAPQKAWVRRADSFCRSSESQVHEVVARGDASTPAGAVALFGRVRRLNAELNDRFLAIEAPPGYKADLARVRVLFAKEERYFDAMYRALKAGDTDTYYALSDRLTDLALDESDILAGLGAYACDVDLLGSFS
jgi:hypothetical protein